MSVDVSGQHSVRNRSIGIQIPPAVGFQLKCLFVDWMEIAETKVLSDLDRLRNRKDVKIGREEWIAVGICLMRLLLVYRDLVLYYSSFDQTGVY